MKDIKEKVRDKNPKIRNPASRLPKELVRSAMLETKEKSRMVADKVGRETGEESPVEYAGNRIERAEQRAGKESASVAYHGGKKLAVKTYEKLKEQKQKQREAATAPLDGETGTGGTSAQAGQSKAKKGRTEAKRSRKCGRNYDHSFSDHCCHHDICTGICRRRNCASFTGTG